MKAAYDAYLESHKELFVKDFTKSKGDIESLIRSAPYFVEYKNNWHFGQGKSTSCYKLDLSHGRVKDKKGSKGTLEEHLEEVLWKTTTKEKSIEERVKEAEAELLKLKKEQEKQLEQQDIPY